MNERLRRIRKAAQIVSIILFIYGMVSQASAQTVPLSDDFNRPDSNTVGNEWTELDTDSGAEVGIENNQLRFIDTSDLNNRPMIHRQFTPNPAAGQLTWSFIFDWKLSGNEDTYSIFMQLGSEASLTYPATDVIPDEGVAVNLVWTVIGGSHETLGYSIDGTYTALGEISGRKSIEVIVDLVAQTYTVFVGGAVLEADIPFDNAVSIDTVRYIAHQVNEGSFSGRNFDDVLITELDCSGPGNQPPVAHNRNLTVNRSSDVDITLTATDCDDTGLTFSTVDLPVHGNLSGTPPDVNYMPASGYTGYDSFTFKANDGEDDSNIATVSIIVGPLQPSTDFSETVDGVGLYWEKARYWDYSINFDMATYIPFGLARPSGYDPDETTQYPLVLYFHGASARGENNTALTRPTARFFARSAQTDPALYNAFVLTPQCANFNRWVDWAPDGGPYDQTNIADTDGGIYGEYMHLTENLLSFIIDSGHNGLLSLILNIDADDIDLTRIYVVGESMGGQGTWDIVARHPLIFAGAIAVGANGPKNKLDELRATPLWALHGEVDTVVTNTLPTAGYPFGGGSLGMMALLDPGFDGSDSTESVYIDDPLSDLEDPPTTWQAFIYSEFVGEDHIPPALDWTQITTSGVGEWLFAQTLTPATCPGDLNGDGDSDGDDLARLIENFDPSKLSGFAADFGSDVCP